ncbi:MAG: hypothetical protein Q7U91_15185 [Sideroxyarcus sp.]|nr:hypothetical protein [Sideroxyarcus sp.]
MSFRSAWISGIAALLLPLAALAALVGDDNFVGPPPPPQLAPEAVIKALDKQHEYLSDKLVGFVSSIDRFFGDDRHYQEANESVFQLDVTRVFGYGGENKFVLSGRANAHLPIAQQKLHLLVETDPDKNTTADPKQTQLQAQTVSQTEEPQSFSAALRYVKEAAEPWHLSADGGIKFQGFKTTPFVRARASLVEPVGEWRAKLAETLFWFNTTGAGATTQLDFERTISEPMLFRATSNATWLHDKQNIDLRQDLTLFHKVDERTALLYQASAIGVSQPEERVEDYVLLVSYRYRLHRKWTYLEVSPQLHYPREKDYHSSPSLVVRLEVLFDESK